MSWQRILRFAKMRQVPVIITDETGEDPMILLSLDQLEQALDGGVGPDIPPPTPAPRPTTPSFAPEEVIVPETIEPEREAAFSAITVMVPPMPDEHNDVAHAEGRVVAPEQPTTEASHDVITVPPQVDPATTPSAPTEPEKRQSIEPLKPPPTTEMSMEERFFLEY